MRKILSLVSLAAVLVFATACPVKPSDVRDSIAAAKGYLDSARVQHPECATQVTATCSLISRAVGAKDTAIDALNQYCASPNYDLNGGECVPNPNAQDHLKAAIRDLDQIMKDVKKIGGK